MSKTKRLRLAPEERRKQLLNCARDIILSRGFSSLTMEAVAKEACVSNPLIYKYFDTRLSLLQELLQREWLRFYSEIRAKLEASDAIEEVVRISVTANFDEVAAGNILSVLRSQPDIEAGLDLKKIGEENGGGRLLIERMMSAYSVTRSQATKMTVFSAGASQMAALHWRTYGGNRKAMIEDVIKFISGGLEKSRST